MFESDEQIAEATEALVSLVLGADRGQLVPWSTIREIAATGDDRRVRYIVRKARTRLRDRYGIALRPQRSDGYRILTESEQVRVPTDDRRRRARRQLHWAGKEIGGVPVGKLGVNDRRLQAASLDALRAEKREIARGLKLTKDREAIPLRPMSVAS